MLNKGIRLLPVFALVLLLTTVYTPPAFSSVTIDDKAPDFTLPKVTGEGEVNLYRMLDKPTLLVFWVSWCGHCQRELPVLESLYKDLGPKGMNAVGVSVDKELDPAQELIKELEITFPNAYAGTQAGKEALASYALRGVPTIYVLDKNGIVKARYLGGVGEETLREDFAELGVK